MSAAGLYGLLLGVLFFLLDWLNSPVVWAIFWAFQAIELTLYARLTWQRTRMVWMTIGGAHAALVSAALVPASLAGYTLNHLPSPWNVVFWVNALTVPLLLGIAWMVDREKFKQCKEYQRNTTLLDMLRFRHIPNLR